ncbi:hypothetical protein TH61_05020 [Rufibacter sp. DG15C]|uniref:hypothetical protein n=1 Tax=Rufibacter sp. DG15C TaxID=1379909 RepID=UPI00078E6994|nr:hypothetical protein [Rufibacter sp. DG15C]AMM50665.1 hypothetical protein TH61_05020 [Rufibacter sp. DG15C]
MKILKWSFYILQVQICFMLSACAGGDYSSELSGDYFYRAEGGDINEILPHLPNRKEIPANVLSYDYNSDFIIAAQKPNATDDPLYDSTLTYPSGRDKIYYWLIVHSDTIVLGPLNKQDFDLALKRYNVPSNLTLQVP